MNKQILLLAALSGTCGIAYEVLYSRMIATYLGDMFYVAAATLSAFLLSLGIGSLLAHKWPRSLGGIEIAIGLYAFLASYLFRYHGESVASTLVNLPVDTATALTLGAFSVLTLPAMMIGFSVPLFTLYQNSLHTQESSSKSFGWIYCAYNSGAAFCVLLIEYVLLRALGISTATQLIAVINIVIGLQILRLSVPVFCKPAIKFRFNRRDMALLLVSIASGILQLLMLKLVGKIFGPFNENFSIILCAALLGIALGSSLVTCTRVSFRHLLLVAGISSTILFSMLGGIIHSWAELNAFYAVDLSLSWLLKILTIFVIVIVPFSLIGGAVPAWLKEESNSFSAGQALALSCFGNCLGFLGMMLLIHQTLADQHTALLVVLGILLASTSFAFKKFSLLALIVMTGCGITIVQSWPAELLQISFRDLASPDTISRELEHRKSAKTYRGINSTIDLVSMDNDEIHYIINGYKSLAIDGEMKSNLRELIFGISPALFSKKHDNALVLGLGTGITSAGVASVYDRLDVVEISPLVSSMIDIFKKQNLSLSTKKHVNIELQDGLIALINSDKKYDAIINTVTSPAYFSSAKLYTVDFFNLASRRLNEKGIYSIWFDSRLTDRGVGIILNSLKQVFKHCRPLHLSAAYHQIICSDWPLELNQAFRIDPQMLEYFSDDLHITIPPAQLIAHLVLATHPRFPNKVITEAEWQEPLNTFDKPTLEFDISENLFDRQIQPDDTIKYRNRYFTKATDSDFPAIHVAERCAAFTLVSKFQQSECLLEAFDGSRQINTAHYLKLVLPHYLEFEKTTEALDLINFIKSRISDAEANLVQPLLSLMCNPDLSERQNSFYEFLYVHALIASGERIPLRSIISMRSPQAIDTVRHFADSLNRLFTLPKNRKYIDRKKNPCS